MFISYIGRESAIAVFYLFLLIQVLITSPTLFSVQALVQCHFAPSFRSGIIVTRGLNGGKRQKCHLLIILTIKFVNWFDSNPMMFVYKSENLYSLRILSIMFLRFFSLFSFQALAGDRDSLSKLKSAVKEMHKTGNSKFMHIIFNLVYLEQEVLVLTRSCLFELFAQKTELSCASQNSLTKMHYSGRKSAFLWAKIYIFSKIVGWKCLECLALSVKFGGESMTIFFPKPQKKCPFFGYFF